jgi:polyphosphate kinase 2 (PPK2 family)
MVDSGIHLIKYWLEVSPDEQARRLKARLNDPRKTWKLTDMDVLSFARWDDYTQARDAMFAATDTAWAPWWVAHSDDKEKARLNIITHLLGQLPYTPQPAREVKFPRRKVGSKYTSPETLPIRRIPEVF